MIAMIGASPPHLLRLLVCSKDCLWPLGEQTDTEIDVGFTSAFEREAEHRNFSRESLLPTPSGDSFTKTDPLWN
jgi:hypothetical protein